MKVATFATVALALMLGVFDNASAQDGRLSDTAVEAAIAIGVDDDDDDFKDLFADCTASPGWRENLGASFNAGLTGTSVTHTGS